MRTLFEKVVHKKISVEDLRDKETEFLKYFEFCLADTSSYDIAKLTLSILKSCKTSLIQNSQTHTKNTLTNYRF